MIKNSFYILIYFFSLNCFFTIYNAQQIAKWGDQGDGTYRNPIIAGDYSDPDVIRVGLDYYMVTSTLQLSPGVHILHSTDLVNWETIGAAFQDVSKLGPKFNWDLMDNYNNGVYAPTIRYHDEKFWIFVNCFMGEGFWMATAKDPKGPWEIRQIKDKNGKPLRTYKWTDPCPFWDNNGKAYLGTSKPGGTWFSYLFEMKPDGTQLLDADVDSMNVLNALLPYPYHGTVISPVFSSEGNKIYKVKSYYYLVHIEFLGKDKGSYILRSKNIYGTKADGSPGKPGDPGSYEKLKFGIEIPGQGSFIDTPDSNWYWIGQFNNISTDGRNTNLVPVKWIDDWPVPGVNIDSQKIGKMIWQTQKPIRSSCIIFPQGSDDFNEGQLNPQWQWNYQPRADKWSLTERKGFLRLYAFKPVVNDSFFKAGNTICQRYLRSDTVVATVKLDIRGLTEGQEAGFSNFNGGIDYANVGVVQNNFEKRIKYEENGKVGLTVVIPANTHNIWFRSTINYSGINTYAYSLDGVVFRNFGGSYQLKQGNFRGDNIGIYCFNNASKSGFIDVDWFHYKFKNN